MTFDKFVYIFRRYSIFFPYLGSDGSIVKNVEVVTDPISAKRIAVITLVHIHEDNKVEEQQIRINESDIALAKSNSIDIIIPCGTYDDFIHGVFIFRVMAPVPPELIV